MVYQAGDCRQKGPAGLGNKVQYHIAAIGGKVEPIGTGTGHQPSARVRGHRQYIRSRIMLFPAPPCPPGPHR